ncbi:MAG: undecaprenyl-diphosphate phosphatase [Candidatus Eisenbacteria bacterium]
MLTLPLAETITPLQAAVLGAVQGLTELLPVSSSAHLYLVPTLLGWKYEGLAFDVALHAGTLVALVVAFWRDWWTLVTDLFSPDAAKAREARTLWALLVVATIPAAIVGKLLDDLAEQHLRSLLLQAATLSVFGLLLWLSDRTKAKGADERSPGWTTGIAMGFAQCLALVPGVSRSGVTMTAGRFMGLSRPAAARFSFLLATPITFGAIMLKLKDVPHDVPGPTLAIAVVSAAVFGMLAIRMLLGMLRRTGFGVFFAYRAALSLGIVAFWWTHR